MERKVRSEQCRMCSRECEVWSSERSLWSTEPALKRDMRRAGWGRWKGVLSVKRSVEGEVWCMQGQVYYVSARNARKVKCGLQGVERVERNQAYNVELGAGRRIGNVQRGMSVESLL